MGIEARDELALAPAAFRTDDVGEVALLGRRPSVDVREQGDERSPALPEEPLAGAPAAPTLDTQTGSRLA